GYRVPVFVLTKQSPPYLRVRQPVVRPLLRKLEWAGPEFAFQIRILGFTFFLRDQLVTNKKGATPTMRNFLLAGVCLIVTCGSAALHAQQKYFQNWPENADPHNIGDRVAMHFLESAHLSP